MNTLLTKVTHFVLDLQYCPYTIYIHSGSNILYKYYFKDKDEAYKALSEMSKELLEYKLKGEKNGL